jgi:hypothetical protein
MRAVSNFDRAGSTAGSAAFKSQQKRRLINAEDGANVQREAKI